MSRYGLLGDKLGHSFSKIIHEKLGFYSYDLLPMEKDELHEFLTKKDFDGVNVTIPYKLDVIPYCDEIDDTVAQIGSANTIVNRNGKLKAYNTDFYGFLYNMQFHHIAMKDKVVMILGSGGTCKTVTAVAKFQGAKEIVIVSRTESDTTITYNQAKQREDVQVLVNASPSGMYPNNQNCPIDINCFPNLEAVVDVIYNPLKTKLLQQAQQRNIPFANGLLMLVAQAKFAAELFIDEKIPDQEIERIYQELKSDLSNVVLVGMPSCGKSTIGRELSKLLNKEFVDIDSLIEEEMKLAIPQIFERYGEIGFRSIERNVVANAAKQTGMIVATGGGVVLNPDNIKDLKQNGIIILIDRSTDELLVGNNRPLSKSKQAIEEMYRNRYPIYMACSDIVVFNNGDIERAVNDTNMQLKSHLGF
ncbi:shikimate kinase [Paludicola sp. MB14-C6]|uniref:shikimate kinase n=1 Tax=Paludihabitans sp. MB14-C6 TaxID=3070656 RepID=UPI0027DD10B4|nr:shikimate kinase [Paludicola sp. MB14-C6]WMJ22523.1 shikimate kinase [Paludicola sp. MB14-C6]